MGIKYKETKGTDELTLQTKLLIRLERDFPTETLTENREEKKRSKHING